MITSLKIILSATWIWMVYIVISTSYDSNLFQEWPYLSSIPWMRATLWDFYGNVLLIFLWLCYKETNKLLWPFWAILFFFLGSIATLGYVLIQLFKLKKGDSLETLIKRKSI